MSTTATLLDSCDEILPVVLVVLVRATCTVLKVKLSYALRRIRTFHLHPQFPFNGVK